MPRGRPEKLTLPPAVTDLPNERQAEAYETFADILDNLGAQEGFIKINRRGKSGGMEFCEQVPATPDFSEEYVSRNWGGGVYSIHMHGPDPERPGRMKYLTSVTFHIAGPARITKADADARAPAAAGGDPVVAALMIELATVKGMLAGMQTRGEQTNPLDNLEKLTTVMRNLMPPTPAGGASPNEILSFAREAVGFAKEMAPEPTGGDGTPWGLIIDKAVEPAIGLISQALAAQKGAPEVSPGTIPPVMVASTGVEIPAMVGAPMWQLEIAKIVPRLLRRARDGKDPGLAAELFLEDAPGGVVEQLSQLAQDEQFVPTVLALAEQHFPDVTPVRQWVADFLQAVRESLLESTATGDEQKPKLVEEDDGA